MAIKSYSFTILFIFTRLYEYKTTKKIKTNFIMKRILSMFAVLFSTIIFAQTTVTGSVSDENNNPIPGANVVAGSTTGTVADFDGNFSLSVDQMPHFQSLFPVLVLTLLH